MPKEHDRTLRNLIDAIGRDATFRLVNEYGGQYRRVPRKPQAWVIKALGKVDGARFCNQFAELQLTIPKAERWKRAERNRQIRADFDAKMPIHDLVTKYDLTAKQIHSILNEPAEPCDEYGFSAMPYYPNGDDRTIDLFGAMR